MSHRATGDDEFECDPHLRASIEDIGHELGIAPLPGPRDYHLAEDEHDFIPPDPALPSHHLSHSYPWILLGLGLVAIILTGYFSFLPEASAWIGVLACLVGGTVLVRRLPHERADDEPTV